MIGLDTNVVVRLMVADDVDQSATASRLIEQTDDAGEPCHLPDAVLCEIAWVLASAYHATKSDLVAAFRALLDDPRYQFEDVDVIREAVFSFERGRGDFSDYVIGIGARRQGARTTYTFDRRLRADETFTVLS